MNTIASPGSQSSDARRCEFSKTFRARRSARHSITVCVLALVAFAAPRLAAASTATFTISAPTIDVKQEPYDQTGYFDVTIRDTVGGDTLYQAQASLMLNPGVSGVSITGADFGQLSNSYGFEYGPEGSYPPGGSPPLIDPYFMNGNSTEIINQAMPYYDSTDADNFDATNGPPVILTANQLYSIEQVYYDIPANTPLGTYALYFDSNDPNVDPNANLVNLISDFSFIYSSPGASVNGALVVTTPEPSSLVLASLASAGLVWAAWKRRRRRVD